MTWKHTVTISAFAVAFLYALFGAIWSNPPGSSGPPGSMWHPWLLVGLVSLGGVANAIAWTVRSIEKADREASIARAYALSDEELEVIKELRAKRGKS